MKNTEKKALLVVSFGTTYDETREKTIDRMEEDLRCAFPDRIFYRAWTSRMVLAKLEKNRQVHYDTVEGALLRMIDDGIRDLLVQPTHMLAGIENDRMLAAIQTCLHSFERVRVGKPLLDSEEDLHRIAKAVRTELLERFCVGSRDALVLMGHGSEHENANAYGKMQQIFREEKMAQVLLGTVEFAPGFEGIPEALAVISPEKVYLAPFLMVAGDHAVNDMAGNGPDSWKSRLENLGYNVECIMRGLGESSLIRELLVSHAKSAREVIEETMFESWYE